MYELLAIWLLAALVPAYIARRRRNGIAFCLILYVMALLVWPLALAVSIFFPRNAKTPRPKAGGLRSGSSALR